MSTLIVGSGITGIAAALLLAQQGEKVILLESAPFPAPLLRGFSREGLHFDTGFHCGGGLGQHGILRSWLQCLGIWQHIDPASLFPLCEEFRFGKEGAHAGLFPALLQAYPASITKQFGEKACSECMRLVAAMHKVLTYSPYTDASKQEEPHFAWGNTQSLHEKLAEFSLPARLQQMIQARCLLYGIPAEQASFHDYALVSGLYFHSSYGLHGGGKTLRAACVKALQHMNVQVRCNAYVRHIYAQNNAVHAVELHSGERLMCERCIFTGHPRQLEHCLEKGVLRPAFYKHIAEMPETPSAFMLFGESTSTYLQQKALYLLPHDVQTSVLNPLESAQPTIYVTGGDAVDGRCPIVAISPSTKRFAEPFAACPQEYRAWKEQEAQRMLALLSERVPELGRLRLHDSASYHTMQNWVAGSSGSLYGLAHTIHTIPLLPVTRLKNFFLAGQNILLPGVLGGIISAALAVGFATGHDKALQEFRRWANNVS